MIARAMHRQLPAVAVGALAAMLPSQAERAFVEVRAEPETCFVQQPLLLRLRIGYDADWFAAHAVARFQQRLDLPVEVNAPWLEELAGAAILPADRDRDPAPAVTLVGNGRLLRATPADDATRNGVRYRVVEVVQRVLPRQAGELALAAPRLRFTFASRFLDDLMHGRMPADETTVTIAGQPRTIAVRPLPEAGRPAGFTGAVGRLKLRVTADRTAVAVGEPVTVTLEITGAGNLAFFAAPRLDDLPGFHVLGRTEAGDRTSRTFRYQLVPLHADLRAVPPIEFWHFDPEPPGAYRALRSASLPLRVEGGPGSTGPDPSTGPAPLPLMPPERGAVPVRLRPWWIGSVLGLPWLLALGWWALRRRRERLARDPAGARARAALARFEGEARRPGSDPAALLTDFLAARLRCPPAAVIGDELAQRLGAAGIEPALAEQAATVLAGLVAARYGSRDGAADPAAVIALVRRLDAAFAAQEGR